MSALVSVDGIDWAQLACGTVEGHGQNLWASEATEISPTADLMRRAIFMDLWKQFVGRLLQTGQRDLDCSKKMRRLLYQDKEDFLVMSLDMDEPATP